jgi:hypothetical protein
MAGLCGALPSQGWLYSQGRQPGRAYRELLLLSFVMCVLQCLLLEHIRAWLALYLYTAHCMELRRAPVTIPKLKDQPSYSAGDNL